MDNKKLVALVGKLQEIVNTLKKVPQHAPVVPNAQEVKQVKEPSVAWFKMQTNW